MTDEGVQYKASFVDFGCQKEGVIVRQNRPVNLDLSKFHFPVTAIASILHRISGVFLFLIIPFVLWGLQYSFESPAHFKYLKAWLASPLMLFISWVVLAALIYHIVAGVRHLLMDIGLGETLSAGRQGAGWSIGITIVAVVVLGIYLIV